MAHSIRPEEVMVQDNFYTATVYEKGAEIIRMYRTLIGVDEFRKGMDLYFERHDGSAVTCDDFRHAMADVASNQWIQHILKTSFERWYSQHGTPTITVNTTQNAKTFSLSLLQQTVALPVPIPVSFTFICPESGNEMTPSLAHTEGEIKLIRPGLAVLYGTQGTLEFDAPQPTVVSLFRDFSAPVKVNYMRPTEHFRLLMVYDGDAFSRFEAGQEYIYSVLLKLIKAYKDNAGKPEETIDESFVEAFKALLVSSGDKNVLSKCLTLPGFAEICNRVDAIDPVAINSSRKMMMRCLGTALYSEFLEMFKSCQISEEYEFSPEQNGKREVAGVCLAYLCSVEPVPKEVVDLVKKSFDNADNMTVRSTALNLLCRLDVPERVQALNLFENLWKENSLVMDKWFAYQCASDLSGALERVQELMKHPLFDLTNPNKMRAVIATFCRRNPEHFHALDGSGYKFLGDMIEQVDKGNPQTAASLCKIFLNWKRFDVERQTLIKLQLERILALENLSTNSYEVCTTALGGSKL